MGPAYRCESDLSLHSENSACLPLFFFLFSFLFPFFFLARARCKLRPTHSATELRNKRQKLAIIGLISGNGAGCLKLAELLPRSETGKLCSGAGWHHVFDGTKGDANLTRVGGCGFWSLPKNLMAQFQFEFNMYSSNKTRDVYIYI